MAQSTQSEPGMPPTSVISAESSRNSSIVQAAGLAAAPTARRGGSRRRARSRRPGPRKSSASVRAPIVGLVGPHALGPVTGALLVRDEAEVELLGVELGVVLGVQPPWRRRRLPARRRSTPSRPPRARCRACACRIRRPSAVSRPLDIGASGAGLKGYVRPSRDVTTPAASRPWPSSASRPPPVGSRHRPRWPTPSGVQAKMASWPIAGAQRQRLRFGEAADGHPLLPAPIHGVDPECGHTGTAGDAAGRPRVQPGGRGYPRPGRSWPGSQAVRTCTGCRNGQGQSPIRRAVPPPTDRVTASPSSGRRSRPRSAGTRPTGRRRRLHGTTLVPGDANMEPVPSQRSPSPPSCPRCWSPTRSSSTTKRSTGCPTGPPGRDEPSARRGAPWLVSFALWANVLQYLDDDAVTVAELRARARTNQASPGRPAPLGLRHAHAAGGQTLRNPPQDGAMVRTTAGRPTGAGRLVPRSQPSSTTVGGCASGRRPSIAWSSPPGGLRRAAHRSAGLPPRDPPDPERQGGAGPVNAASPAMPLPLLPPTAPLSPLLAGSWSPSPSTSSRVRGSRCPSAPTPCACSTAGDTHRGPAPADRRVAGGQRDVRGLAGTTRLRREGAGPDGTRGKVLRLTPKGQKAQQKYRRLLGATEESWRTTYGAATSTTSRAALEHARRGRDFRLLAPGARPGALPRQLAGRAPTTPRDAAALSDGAAPRRLPRWQLRARSGGAADVAVLIGASLSPRRRVAPPRRRGVRRPGRRAAGSPAPAWRSMPPAGA